MTSLSYEDIFNQFLGYVTDYELASLEISDAYELLSEYLHKTVSEPYLRRLFSSLSLNDSVQIITFELENVVDEESDKDFIINILAKGMTIKWLEPQVKKTSLLHQHITSSKESKFHSQASHLAELKGLYEDSQNEVRKIIRDRGYIYNPYLGAK